jgi:cytoskeletal protein CcmA (bactofilin family)
MFSTKSSSSNGNIKKPDAQLETMVGAESFFQGTLRSKGAIRVDGKIEGGVSADGVIIGEQGEIQGDISARTVVVGGKVTGNIHATETLELLAKSQVFGDLHAPQLVIAEGAVFEGSCLMASEKSKIIEVNVNS